MINAERIAAALGGRRKRGGGYMVRCVSHDDRTPSLSLDIAEDGRLLVHCFAGCDAGDIFAELRRRQLLPASSRESPGRQDRRRSHRTRNSNLFYDVRSVPDRRALAIWRATKPAPYSLVQRYLNGRGITLPVPPAIRCHPGLIWSSDAPALPAMVAAVRDCTGTVTAVHRTWLSPDGEQKAEIDAPKKALGTIRGGAVQLATATDKLALVEGIEDGLALMQMSGCPVWALLGTSGFHSFVPPERVHTLILAPDADPAGDRAVAESAARLLAMGLTVKHLRPPDGRDWCDLLPDFEERAGIMQFDGERHQSDAELAAFTEIVGAEIRRA